MIDATILIGIDGRHVWLGRFSVPTKEEIDAISDTLTTQAMSADVFTVSGDYWNAASELTFKHLRSVGVPHDWTGLSAFLEKRHASLSSV